MIQIFAVLLLLIFSSYGQTLLEVIDIAIEESPYLKRYMYRVKSVEGNLKKAKSTLNPQLNLEFGRIYSQIEGESGFNITSFSINQPLRLWNEKEFAVKSVKYTQSAFLEFFKFQKNILISNIYKNFYNALSLKYQIDIKNKQLNTLSQLYSFIKKSYELGEITKLDLLRIQKDIGVERSNLNILEAKYKAALNKLSALVGKQIKDVEGDLYAFNKVQTIILDEVPEIKYLTFLAKSIDQQIKRQKALAKPRISVGFVAGEDEVDLGKYDFGVAISSTVPLFYKNQGEIINLSSKKGEIIQQINQAKISYNQQFKSLSLQIKVLEKQFENIKKGVLPSITEALELAKKSYELRTITYFELSNIITQYYDTLYYKVQLAYQIHDLYGDYIKIGGIK